jgi:hypothetical protein
MGGLGGPSLRSGLVASTVQWQFDEVGGVTYDIAGGSRVRSRINSTGTRPTSWCRPVLPSRRADLELYFGHPHFQRRFVRSVSCSAITALILYGEACSV